MKKDSSFQKFSYFSSEERVMAVYKSGLPKLYQDNPLIEALPRPISSISEITKALTNAPSLDPSIRGMDAHLRLPYLQLLNTVMYPTQRHIKAFRDVDIMIRMGLYARNPYQNGRLIQPNLPFPQSDPKDGQEEHDQNYLKHLTETNSATTEEAQLDQISTRKHQRHNLSMITSSALIGPSGMGKTTLIDSILYTYPQVICHSAYDNQPYNFQHLVWVKLECPFDGSHKQLILNLIDTIDQSLRTNFMESHAGKGTLTVDALIPRVQDLNHVLRIGLIVIDEIQRLSKLPGKSINNLMEFLVQFTNKVKIPILFIGTNSSLDFLTEAMQQIRRVSAHGNIEWELPRINPYDNDNTNQSYKDWEKLVEFLFEKYQIVRDPIPIPLDPEIIRVMFEKTHGITDLTVSLFKFVQKYLIEKQEIAVEPIAEQITPKLIQKIADTEMSLIQPAIQALRLGTENALSKFEDLYYLYKTDKEQWGATSISTSNASSTDKDTSMTPSGSSLLYPPQTLATSLIRKAPKSQKSKKIAEKRSKKVIKDPKNAGNENRADGD